MTDKNYEVFEVGSNLVKAWVKGVTFEDKAKEQVFNVAKLPFIHQWVAIMPDVHSGMGATIGSVIPTYKAVIPAAVGVDIGCGMMALRTDLTASDLPENLHPLREAIEKAVPHGRTNNGGRGDKGAWGDIPGAVGEAWTGLEEGFKAIVEKHPHLAKTNNVHHLGSLGTGNHFIEVCLDEDQRVWFMLHSGSRGVGNSIGGYFIELAKKDMKQWMINLPDEDLSYLPEGTEHFRDYVRAVEWAQDFARTNREVMMKNLLKAVSSVEGLRPFQADLEAVNCHHNYVSRENHYGKNVIVTRKGAVRAREGEMVIIPGSMGARSYIARGKGNPESFDSCSHGAGRVMSRNEAKRRFTVADQERATEGVECRKDADVIDEIPMAYKDIDAVMEAQKDLVEVVYKLKQVVCVKG